MKIFLTGAFGNVGTSTLKKLLKNGHEVKCFDINNSQNAKTQKKMLGKGQFDTVWGDLTKPADVNDAVKDIDCIVHLAAIIPPLSEKLPDLAYKVNVEGTRNLLTAAKKLNKAPKFIVASSVSVYGATMHLSAPRCADDSLCPTDHYSRTKVEVENLVKDSGLPWLILRLGAVSIPKIPHKLDSIMFEVPLDQRIEFVHSKDVGTAFANAVTVDATNKILLIGGGKECQIYQRTYIESMFSALGLSMLPDTAFRVPKKDDEWFYTDWMDCDEAQKLLKFQEHTFQGYIEKFKKQVSMRRFGLRMVAPFAKLSLLIMSPYYKFSQGSSTEIDLNDYRYLKSLFGENKDVIDKLNERIDQLETRIQELEKIKL